MDVSKYKLHERKYLRNLVHYDYEGVWARLTTLTIQRLIYLIPYVKINQGNSTAVLEYQCDANWYQECRQTATSCHCCIPLTASAGAPIYTRL